MRVLLDTHTLLWYVLGDTQLSVTARQAIDAWMGNTSVLGESRAINNVAGRAGGTGQSGELSGDSALDAYSVDRIW